MILDYNTIGFSQPVLYEGIHITCRSIFGYHYRVKKQEQAVDFVSDFIKEINSTIRNNRIHLLLIDYLALLVEIPFAVCLLLFSSPVLDKDNLGILFIVLTVVFALVFIVLKFLNISYLNRDLQAFLDKKKDALTLVGFNALLIKSRFNDRAPDIFLNLLLEKKDMGLNSPSVPVSNDDNNVSLKSSEIPKKKKKECVILKSVPFLRKQMSEEHPLKTGDVEIQIDNEVEMIPPKIEEEQRSAEIPKGEEDFDDIEENKTQIVEKKISRNVVNSDRKAELGKWFSDEIVEKTKYID